MTRPTLGNANTFRSCIMLLAILQCGIVRPVSAAENKGQHRGCIPKSLRSLRDRTVACTLLFDNDSFCGHCRFSSCSIILIDSSGSERTVNYVALKVAHLSLETNEQIVISQLPGYQHFFRMIGEKSGLGLYSCFTVHSTADLLNSHLYTYDGIKLRRLTQRFRKKRLRRSQIRDIGSRDGIPLADSLDKAGVIRIFRTG